MANFPHFLVIGAAKSGTTSLHEYLRQHPQITLPIQKETNYFLFLKEGMKVDNPYKGFFIDNYLLSQETYRNSFEPKEGASVFGEVCPNYLHYPNAAFNISKTVPSAKIIAILRHPAERLVSHLKFFLAKYGNVSSEELNNLVSSVETNIDVNRIFDIGNYHKHLLKYYQLFPKENIKIFLYEDLVNNSGTLMEDLTKFIGLPNFPYVTNKKFNISGVPRHPWIYQKLGRTPFSRTFRKILPKSIYQSIRPIAEKIFFKKIDSLPEENLVQLKKYYHEEINQLQDLIDRDLSSWLEV